MQIQIKALDHLVLNVSDVQASIDFYAGILGLHTERLAEYRSGEAPFPSLRLSATTIIDLFPPALHNSGGQGSNLNHLAFDAGASVAAIEMFLEQAGIEIVRRSEMTFGARGYALCSFYIHDPDGNVVELRSYDAVAGP